jgi:hypothetical protein
MDQCMIMESEGSGQRTDGAVSRIRHSRRDQESKIEMVGSRRKDVRRQGYQKTVYEQT